MMDYNIIPAAELDRIASTGASILDVRTPMEHAQNRLVQPHDHVPLDELNPEDYMLRRGLDRNDAIYLLCRSGGRARQAADLFIKAGYPNIHVIDGGLTACQACGQEVTGISTVHQTSETGLKKTIRIIPLERQVRIAAGFLVALGAVLGFVLIPGFHLLSLFVGLGLIYAGITDRCGMGLLLAKAPWNKPDMTDLVSAGNACPVLKSARETGAGKVEGGCA